MTATDGVIRSLAALRERAAALQTRRVAVAAATGPETLRAAVLAKAGELAEPILVTDSAPSRPTRLRSRSSEPLIRERSRR